MTGPEFAITVVAPFLVGWLMGRYSARRQP
jgi:hypothetical protein